MASGGEALAGMSNGTRDAVAAVLFMQSATLAMDVYSAVNSSPWTVENFGADPEKAKSVREYVKHGAALSIFFSVGAAWIAHSFWPIAGMVVALAYMWWLYMRALGRGEVSGSNQWAKGNAQ